MSVAKLKCGDQLFIGADDKALALHDYYDNMLGVSVVGRHSLDLEFLGLN